jgi:hypothetical protein
MMITALDRFQRECHEPAIHYNRQTAFARSNRSVGMPQLCANDRAGLAFANSLAVHQNVIGKFNGSVVGVQWLSRGKNRRRSAARIRKMLNKLRASRVLKLSCLKRKI